MSDVPYKPGDKVEVRHAPEWQNEHRSRDAEKAKKLGKPIPHFVGNAAAYMRSDEAYVVLAVTETGGLRLRGFVPQVSPSDVRPSRQPVFR
jgi:hypothetical protein